MWDASALCRKPVTAAVRGHTLSGGCELAMHADLIVAGKGVRFGPTEVLIGLMPGGGATQRLPRAIGKFAAMRLLLTGQPTPSADAMALAAQLARGPQAAIRAIREAVIAGMNQPLQQGLEFEHRNFALLFDGVEKVEGTSARLEKRAARFDL